MLSKRCVSTTRRGVLIYTPQKTHLIVCYFKDKRCSGNALVFTVHLRIPHVFGVMGVMMMRDTWHLKLFFSLDQDVGFGGQPVSVGDFFGNDKIKFLSFKKLNF